MDTRILVIVLGTLVALVGAATHVYARVRFRTAIAPGPWPQVRPGKWGLRREWFTSEHGYRLGRRSAAAISIGGLIALVGSLL